MGVCWKWRVPSILVFLREKMKNIYRAIVGDRQISKAFSKVDMDLGSWSGNCGCGGESHRVRQRIHCFSQVETKGREQ